MSAPLTYAPPTRRTPPSKCVVGWVLFLAGLATAHVGVFALPTISRGTGQLYHTRWVPVGTAPGLSHLLDYRDAGAMWWRSRFVIAALAVDGLFVAAGVGSWFAGRRGAGRSMLVILVFLQGVLLAVGTLPAYLDDDPLGLRPPTSFRRALVHRASAWAARQDVFIQVAGMLASAGAMVLLSRRIAPMLRGRDRTIRPVPMAPLAVVLILVGFAPIALARPPNGSYESFRVKTDNVPQAEIAGWVLPAKGVGNGTAFLLHGYNNSKEYLVGWEWIRDKENWNVVMFDFREHGESTRSSHLSSLGYHEIWDVKAVVDYAQRKGLPRPYVIYGRSLGGATGLRWASMDPRISGVVACSPFKNAYLASQQLPASRLHIPMLPSPFTLSPGFKGMLKAVDIPSAVARRNDLRIWIISGELDSFPPEDQREILAASGSPAGMKRLLVAPGHNHRDVWAYKGHDPFVREFLAATLADRGPTAASRGWMAGVLCGAAVVGVAGVVVYARKMRRRVREVTPELPPPLDQVPAS